MGIQDIITTLCDQTAVYWGNPIKDGFGGYAFDDAVEINCVWEDTTELIRDSQGNEITSRAKVFVVQDLDEEGYLYLGSLDDLESAPVPSEVEKAFQIKRFDKTKALRKEEYLRIAYL